MASSSASVGQEGENVSGGIAVKMDPNFSLWRHVEVVELDAGGG